MLKPSANYEALYSDFSWDIPEFYNIGQDVCDRIVLSAPDATAIIDASTPDAVNEISFAELRDLSNQYAHVLSDVAAMGDRIAVLIPQSIETAAAHIAIMKMGCISLPLFSLFGPEALAHRLKNSGAKAIVTNREGAEKIAGIRKELPDLKHVFTVDGAWPETFDLTKRAAEKPTDFDVVKTHADDPALLIYTSGTTGNPKGALHAHRVLLGHLPGVEMSHDFFPQPGDKIWTPADWAWIGGLLDVLLPALHHGVPVVACRFQKFDATAAFDLIETQGIQNAFLPPTALKMMRQGGEGRKAPMRSVASGGETLGKSLIAWGQDTFGTTINEFYGQTECNMIVSSCAAIEPAEPGVMGFPVPGHKVEVLDTETAEPLGIGEDGNIAVQAPDPVMFLEYWNNASATAGKFVDHNGSQWLLTGDTGHKTASGRIRFVGRDDDVISSSGYRIGPGEIEDCILTHPAVAMTGVVGKADDLRGEIVVAFVMLANGQKESDGLKEDIQHHVKERLAAYEYPREIYMVDTLPMTTTGKIIRAKLRAKLSQ